MSQRPPNTLFWRVLSANTSCVICQTKYEDGEDKIRLTCTHEFHETCFTEYENHVLPEESLKCPVCRHIIPKMHQLFTPTLSPQQQITQPVIAPIPLQQQSSLPRVSLPILNTNRFSDANPQLITYSRGRRLFPDRGRSQIVLR